MTKQGAKMSFHANRVETVWEKRIMGLSLRFTKSYFKVLI